MDSILGITFVLMQGLSCCLREVIEVSCSGSSTAETWTQVQTIWSCTQYIPMLFSSSISISQSKFVNARLYVAPSKCCRFFYGSWVTHRHLASQCYTLYTNQLACHWTSTPKRKVHISCWKGKQTNFGTFLHIQRSACKYNSNDLFQKVAEGWKPSLHT